MAQFVLFLEISDSDPKFQSSGRGRVLDKIFLEQDIKQTVALARGILTLARELLPFRPVEVVLFISCKKRSVHWRLKWSRKRSSSLSLQILTESVRLIA